MSSVLYEQLEKTAVITLNAPEKQNALSTAMRTELRDLLDQVTADDGVRSIILTGAGKHFCSGGDISEMGASDGAVDLSRSRLRMGILHAILRHLVAGPKPVVACLRGNAFGGGLSLAMACDYVIADSTGKLCASFARIGLVADVGLLWTLPQRVGARIARNLLLSANVVEADEAGRIGLVDIVTSPDEAMEQALRKSREWEALAPLSHAATKLGLARSSGTAEQAMAFESDVQSALFTTADHIEARKAFLAKRKPVFTGR
ncbi:enoyl-CoA hydratase/isomerase family protein [Ferrovibrio sp.]|uniref:enoyl-CoA hydratase/isomerase family protein n=1 Tax=Ferrovibrio sp. TaxID=1917215 RepID=UPI001BBC3633|nr:enoyl-CoA hydratase/isomerase family protein [Ferrovibrio sp.]MBS4049483.1 enoyl-CoA hydratase/isomerase family protein [Alphaproteobacteria bacterium]